MHVWVKLLASWTTWIQKPGLSSVFWSDHLVFPWLHGSRTSGHKYKSCINSQNKSFNFQSVELMWWHFYWLLQILGDQQAALVGQGAFKKGQAKNTYVSQLDYRLDWISMYTYADWLYQQSGSFLDLWMICASLADMIDINFCYHLLSKLVPKQPSLFCLTHIISSEALPYRGCTGMKAIEL